MPVPPSPDATRPTAEIGPVFARAGFEEAAVAAQRWKETWSRLEPTSAFRKHWGGTWRTLPACASPDLALSQLLRYIDGDAADEGEDVAERRARRWGRSRPFRDGFLRLAGLSPALGDSLLRAWESFDPDRWQQAWETPASLATRLASVVGELEEAAYLRAVRRFQRAEILRIAYLDCVQGLPVRQVAQQISILADVVISSCFQRARRETAERMGLRPPERGFSVLALGKLGGEELNYSSDVDLNFIFDENLDSIERKSGQNIEDPLEIEGVFRRIAERLISYLTKFHGEGALYRVDTRLRPDGSSGRLVWSARAAINYYYSAGRTWERQALIRLRHISGDEALSRHLRDELQNFIFPATLSAEELSSMRELKLQVERMAGDRSEPSGEIKIGEGGIRDVEYIVQFLQLLHASRIPSLSQANVFDALEILQEEGLLRAEETDVLRQGYRFLRRVEHHLQLAHMLQTHRLPDDPRDLHRLARGLGFDSVAQFRGKLALHALSIRRVYRLMFEQATEERPVEEVLPVLLDLPRDSVGEEGPRLLAPYGFDDTERAFTRLQSLARQDRSLVDTGYAKQAFRQLIFKLLREISQQADPDRTLSNFEDCVRTLGARSVFYALLNESEEILRLFVALCARSTLFVEILRRQPAIFDEVVDALLTGYRFDARSLKEEVHQLAEMGGDFQRELFNLKYIHTLLNVIRDLEGRERLRITLLHTSEVAETLLHGVLHQAQETARKKLGSWKGSAPRFVLLGLGKLGGQEMTYQSDVDVIFLHDGDGTTDRGIDTQEYFERFSHVVLAGCKVADSLGPLLQVDVRLRPLGSHNSLSISLAGWKRYFLDGTARNWERQAFLRARPIYGDAGLGEEVMRFVREDLILGGVAGPKDAESLRKDVWDMRRKLQKHAGESDLKRGYGGIMDVEFLVQTLQLLHGKKEPEIIVANTALGVERLAHVGLLTDAQSSELFNSYQFLRWIENRLSLVTEPGQSLETMDEAQLESTIQKIGYSSTGEESATSIFLDEVQYHRRKNREALLAVLDRREK